MDLRLHLRVLWRFRLLVSIGFVCALALMFLATARVDLKTHTVSYRSSQEWISYSHIFVTQKGFPYGAVNSGQDSPAALATNAIFYSQLANSDRVRKLAFGGSNPPGTVQASPVLASASTSDALPIVSIAATSTTPALAMKTAQLETNALIGYIHSLQSQAQINPANRVVLQVIQQPDAASLLKGRSKTLPIVVFLLTMLAVVGLAFVLENLRPMSQELEPPVVGVAAAKNLA